MEPKLVGGIAIQSGEPGTCMSGAINLPFFQSSRKPGNLATELLLHKPENLVSKLYDVNTGLSC